MACPIWIRLAKFCAGGQGARQSVSKKTNRCLPRPLPPVAAMLAIACRERPTPAPCDGKHRGYGGEGALSSYLNGVDVRPYQAERRVGQAGRPFAELVAGHMDRPPMGLRAGRRTVTPTQGNGDWGLARSIHY